MKTETLIWMTVAVAEAMLILFFGIGQTISGG